MLVLVTGMMRSGSTFVVNAVRQLLSQHGEQVYCEAADEIAESIQCHGLNADHMIYKQHLGSAFSRAMIQQRCSKNICSQRDPQEAMASWMQVFGYSFEESLDVFKKSIDFTEFQRDKALLIDYADIESDNVDVVHRIAEYLGTPAAMTICREISEALDKDKVRQKCDSLQLTKCVNVGKSFYDPETMFHRHHIRGSNAVAAERYFTAEQRSIICAELNSTHNQRQESP